MCGRTIQIEVVLLDILAVIALAVGESEQALFDNGILAVPQREREAEKLLVIADPADPVFAPAIGPAASMVVGERFP